MTETTEFTIGNPPSYTLGEPYISALVPLVIILALIMSAISYIINYHSKRLDFEKPKKPTWPVITSIVAAVAVGFGGLFMHNYIADKNRNMHEIDSTAVKEQLHEKYGANDIQESENEENRSENSKNQRVYVDDPSKNTWKADALTIGNETYRDCVVTFTNPHKQGDNTVADTKLTCYNKESKNITIQPNN